MDKLKFNFKYLAALISVSLANNSSADSAIETSTDVQFKQDQGVHAVVLNQAIPLQLASHRSHSSHRSHRSHSSHRSSSGGGYRSPEPVYTAPQPVYTPPARQASPSSTPKTEPKNTSTIQEPKAKLNNLTVKENSKSNSSVKHQQYDLQTVITRIQLALTFEGYYKGNVDGIMGPETRKAIVAYRKAKGLSPNSLIDAALLNSLNILAQ